MNLRRAGLAALGLLALTAPLAACADPKAEQARGQTRGDPITEIAKDDPEMRAAIAAARRTLPEFLALLERPPAGTGDYSFKYPLAGWEHIWVEDIARDGDALTGKLANAPVGEGYELGQEVRVPLSEVSDWGYRDAQGVMQGHRTTRALLPRIDPGDAQAIRTALGWKD